MSLAGETGAAIVADGGLCGFSLTINSSPPRVFVPGQLWGDISKAALYQVICSYLVSQLEEKSLIEAYDALRDIHSWQQDSKLIEHRDPEISRFIPASHGNVVLNEPFVWD